ncbi:hypothetical protein PR202_ga04249 [Eleusine coracana subsp. coracana]|uniref:RBR-type E3 ubiquitin transferase n=1 Tax=Eleusine coracana subsp. coracana TaxID=191504 RepID=A0AAV5BPG4_ELECO|nr:hypothetical protein PR202_ga04249 [Eleusine coracana subsp. coracana]
MMMAGGGDDGLDLAFKLQLAEAIQASPESSDAAYALALHAADLARAAHDALFARELAAIPEDRWAHDGDDFERPLDLDDPSSSSARRPLFFRVLFKGMASKDVVGPRVRDPGVAVLAAAVCGPQGEVLLRVQKVVEEGFVGGREVLEAMALMEGLHAALGLGIRRVHVVTDYRALHNHVVLFKCVNDVRLIQLHGIWRVTQKKVAEMLNQVVSVQRKFEQAELLLVYRSEVNYVIKLARDCIDDHIARAHAANASKERRETCSICFEDTDISKFHEIEGCTHRFCFPCMKEHVRVKLLDGMLPTCPQDGCATKLSVEGSKIFLSQKLLEIMVERIREGQIPPTQKIYCPYPKCSALMSLSELIQPLQQSSSKYTAADAVTLRKCVRCRGSFCIRCKVPWHDKMTCYQYKRRYPHARPEDVKLQNLAKQRCGYEFCYTCGKEWKEKKATCTCPLWEERNIIRHDGNGDVYYLDEEEDYYDEEDDYDVHYVEEGNISYNQVYWHYDDRRGNYHHYNY